MAESVEEKHCCISHEFFRAASENPNKIVAINALGGIRIFKELQDKNNTADFDGDEDRLFESLRKSQSPPLYEGDECFTASDILASVDFLSSRIRHILDGGDDPNLIRPRDYIPRDPVVHAEFSKSPQVLDITEDKSVNIQRLHTPQILGIYMEPSVEYIIAVLSILRCGGAFMPLDPSWPKERILSTVLYSKVGLIIGHRSSFNVPSHNHLDKSHWLVDKGSCSVLCMSMKGNLKEHLVQSHLVWPCEIRSMRSFCYLMYTSGSTGKPKGICGTEQGLMNRFLWMQKLFPFHAEEFLLFKTSISFIDHLQEFLSAILTCSTLIIPPFQELKANPFYVVNFLKAYHLTRLTAVPSLVRAILPAMKNLHNNRIQRSLQVLVLSGEVLSLSLWEVLSKLLPQTTILNLYGSTEVSGDCTYFDCRKLPAILETEALSSVPIGTPISKCDIMLVGDSGAADEGEIHVAGLCLSVGCFLDATIVALDYVSPAPDVLCNFHCKKDLRTKLYFRTGDFAKRLKSGDLVFLGRKDRMIKVNGKRIALEEIENMLSEHPDVVDSAVISFKCQGDISCLAAYLITKENDGSSKVLSSSVRSWLLRRLPLEMVPNHYYYTKSLPLSATGKIDYSLLATLTSSLEDQADTDNIHSNCFHLHIIKEAFCDALMVEKVEDDDDFFVMGGNSIAAAHAAHKLGIDMRLLYIFSSPSKLQNAISREGSSKNLASVDSKFEVYPRAHKRNLMHFSDSKNTDVYGYKPLKRLFGIFSKAEDDSSLCSKQLKADSILNMDSEGVVSSNGCPLFSNFKFSSACSFGRHNNILCEGKYELSEMHNACGLLKTPSHDKGHMQELWKVCLDSCVDASPLVVFKDRDVYLFIGSHSHKFLCVNAVSGSIQWEIKLEGRIECSAAVLSDFSQVVVGCYKGKIYFLDFMTGNICWVFQTGGELGGAVACSASFMKDDLTKLISFPTITRLHWSVPFPDDILACVKAEPVADKSRNLIWCGSHDQNLYALDYRKNCCVFKISCGGSVYGSPAIDKVHNTLYVASTSGRVTAISLKTLPFSTLWLYELGVPVFGSLSVSALNGCVMCCLVDGHVVALGSNGSILWRANTGGPIFAGACISYVLSPQVLICSRSGSVYSFDLENGELLWEYNVGDPITSSPYVDENMQLLSDPSYSSNRSRLACICSSSGSIFLLRLNSNTSSRTIRTENSLVDPMVQEFARLDLQGEIFSSPIMIGGRIFVGCRDDHVHCISIEGRTSVAK